MKRLCSDDDDDDGGCKTRDPLFVFMGSRSAGDYYAGLGINERRPPHASLRLELEEGRCWAGVLRPFFLDTMGSF